MPARIEASLPSYTTPFIGRDDEIAVITERLDDPDCHLLTLVGSGGMGKTRLAVEVAKNIAQTSMPADGIYFVDLQPVNAGDLLVTAIANAIGILLSGPQNPHDQLLNILSERETIVLLDNFEQLLDNVDLLSDIVRSAPQAKLLVTSREALNIQEEWVWRLSGLQVPAYQPEANIESFSAVQLFTERAHRARQDFTLTGQETHVARICQLVEGMPLALELAASWTKALSCAEIADEIQRSLNFLTTNMRNVPERHRSMQAIFDHSWRLLTDEERAVFPKLSVFRGGFRREAAEQVAGASLVVLAGLMDKSFLRLSADGRYTIHELMRQYGEERLDDEAKKDAQNRHCIYYAGFLHARQLPLRGLQQAVALDEIGHELDNIRVSWEWAVEHDMRDEIHQSMHSLFLFCHIRAQNVEGERLFDLAVNRFEQKDSATLAYLLMARTNLATFNGRVVGVDQFPRAIRLVDEFWSEDELALLLWTYIWIREELIAKHLFDDLQYEQVCRELLERFRIHNQPWGAAYMLYCLGVIFQNFKGQLAEAESYYRQSLDGFHQIGDRWASAWSVMGLARVSESSQQYREALQLWQEHRDICAEVGDQGGVVNALSRKARISLRLQDHHTARFYIAQGIQSHLESGAPFLQMNLVFQSLIELLLSEDRHEQAAELSSFQHHLADKAHAPKVVAEADQRLASLAQLLPPDIYEQAIVRGKSLNLRTILKQLQDELADYSPVQISLSPAASQSLIDPLTERELEVLRLLAAGRSNREIAHDLVLALGTVKWYISEIYSKLGVASRTQAIARAGELKLLS
jgi:predicted ATPase/DNA-binding CsgD family transcriptional regulator